MRKMSKEAQMHANGGKVHVYHSAGCTLCDARFEATKITQGVKYVMELGRQHCYAKGGPSKGHRYMVLY
ncbi:MAG: hypothetical protein K2I10_12135 [Lachnospiraceae bacterium]|nr:hypothetical protein [Lachnospiraceae bacterium]